MTSINVYEINSYEIDLSILINGNYIYELELLYNQNMEIYDLLVIKRNININTYKSANNEENAIIYFNNNRVIDDIIISANNFINLYRNNLLNLIENMSNNNPIKLKIIYICICNYIIYNTIYQKMSNININYIQKRQFELIIEQVKLFVCPMFNIFYHNYVLLRRRNHNAQAEFREIESYMDIRYVRDLLLLKDQYYLERTMRILVQRLNCINSTNISNDMGHTHQIAILNSSIDLIDHKIAMLTR